MGSCDGGWWAGSRSDAIYASCEGWAVLPAWETVGFLGRRLGEQSLPAQEASWPAASITGVTMGAVLGVFSLASWVSSESCVLSKPSIWGRALGSSKNRPDPNGPRSQRPLGEVGRPGPRGFFCFFVGGVGGRRSRPQSATSSGQDVASRRAFGVSGGMCEVKPPLFTIAVAPPPQTFRTLGSFGAGGGSRNESSLGGGSLVRFEAVLKVASFSFGRLE